MSASCQDPEGSRGGWDGIGGKRLLEPALSCPPHPSEELALLFLSAGRPVGGGEDGRPFTGLHLPFPGSPDQMTSSGEDMWGPQPPPQESPPTARPLMRGREARVSKVDGKSRHPAGRIDSQTWRNREVQTDRQRQRGEAGRAQLEEAVSRLEGLSVMMRGRRGGGGAQEPPEARASREEAKHCPHHTHTHTAGYEAIFHFILLPPPPPFSPTLTPIQQ